MACYADPAPGAKSLREHSVQFGTGLKPGLNTNTAQWQLAQIMKAERGTDSPEVC